MLHQAPAARSSPLVADNHYVRVFLPQVGAEMVQDSTHRSQFKIGPYSSVVRV
jgi:hypothetical protein